MKRSVNLSSDRVETNWQESKGRTKDPGIDLVLTRQWPFMNDKPFVLEKVDTSHLPLPLHLLLPSHLSLPSAVWSDSFSNLKAHSFFHQFFCHSFVTTLTSTFEFHVGDAIAMNPGYLKLRKIRAAQQIAKTVSSSTGIRFFIFQLLEFLLTGSFYSLQIANSQNKVLLPAGSLMLNIADKDYDINSSTITPKRK